MTSPRTETYSVKAVNSAWASENKMHDETVAKKLGFRGGLVPGIDVFAYMMHVPVARWGHEFLRRGQAEIRFTKPIYDGDLATVMATEVEGGLDLRVESEGQLCASGRVGLLGSPASVELADFVESLPLEEDERPEAGPDSYPVGSWIGMHPFQLDADFHAQYMKDISEQQSMFQREAIVHPASIMRLANWALMHNVRLGPWIHVGSSMTLMRPASVGDVLTIRALVKANYEKKNRRYVELDALAVSNGSVPVARISHVAIYLLQET